MSIVYKYTNKQTKQIEYIGIVYSDKKTLGERVVEHSKEEKFQDKNWKIQYFECENRSVAEAWESHLIEKYETYKYLNICKKGWGLNPYIPDDENLWQDYTEEAEKIIKKSINDIFKEQYGISIDNIFNFTDGRFIRIFKKQGFNNSDKIGLSIFMDGLTQYLFENKIISIVACFETKVSFMSHVKGYDEYGFCNIEIEEYSEEAINKVRELYVS